LHSRSHSVYHHPVYDRDPLFTGDSRVGNIRTPSSSEIGEAVRPELQVVNQLSQAEWAIAREVCVRLGLHRDRDERLIVLAVQDGHAAGVALGEIEDKMVAAWRNMVDTRPAGMAPFNLKKFFSGDRWRQPAGSFWFNARDNRPQLVLRMPSTEKFPGVCPGCGAHLDFAAVEFQQHTAWCLDCQVSCNPDPDA
jgi:hypothetical protein